MGNKKYIVLYPRWRPHSGEKKAIGSVLSDNPILIFPVQVRPAQDDRGRA